MGKLFTYLASFILIMIFVAQNSSNIASVKFLWWKIDNLPMSAVIIGAFILGSLWSVPFYWKSFIRQRQRENKLRKEILKLKNALEEKRKLDLDRVREMKNS